MIRGEVWWADLPKPVGRRPVLLLSRNEAYRIRTAVTVAEITTTIRNIPVEVGLSEKDGLPRPCAVNLDTIITVPKNRLTQRICRLTPQKIADVNRAIIFALSLPDTGLD